ncbi:MAG: putative toxin-antitoxin system toxin component, PIN family [Fibrobacteres bacterium]|nr:putative toxin-antitoxin system toxin component, PIN family [Fibrobacterota bacterium]
MPISSQNADRLERQLPEKLGMRIIVDTNLWVSFLIGKRLAHLNLILTTPGITVIYSKEILAEIEEVCARPKLRKLISTANVHNFIVLIRQTGECCKIVSNISNCRDKDDDFLLNLSCDSNADYIVTGDDDLLSMKVYKKTKIINFRDLEKLI